MRRASLAVGLVATIAIVFVLCACAPATNEHPRATVSHSPTPQAVTPTVRVPVTCGTLFTDAMASTLIDSPVNIRRDATTTPVAITDIAQRQQGSLGCLWAGEREDSGYVEDLAVDITPDAKAGFIANRSSFSNENPPVVTNTAGDQSVYGCDTAGALSCTANMLVDDYWVSAHLVNIVDSAISPAEASSRIQQVLSTVAAALENTKAGPVWNPPGPTLPTFCSSAASTAKVNTALGVSDSAPVGDDELEADAASYTQLAGDYAQCGWSTDSESEPFSYLSVAMLKGGAWVLPELPGQKNTKNYMLSAYGSMTVPGATPAAGNCNVLANECEVALSIGTLLVVVQLDDPSEAQSSAALAAIVADIKAS